MGISCGHLISAHIQYFFFWKKGLKIPNGQSESVNRRTCGTFTKRNTTNNDLQNTTRKTTDRAFRIPLKDIQVPRKSRCSGRWCSSCSTSSTHRVTVKPHEQLMICKFYKQKIKKGARTGLIVTNKKIVNWKCRPLLPSNEPPLVGNFLHTVKRTWHYLDKRHEKHSVLS